MFEPNGSSPIWYGDTASMDLNLRVFGWKPFISSNCVYCLLVHFSITVWLCMFTLASLEIMVNKTLSYLSVGVKDLKPH